MQLSLEVDSPRTASRSRLRAPVSRRLSVVGLFAGIGGLELGLKSAGHETLELCEIDKTARAVLKRHFPEAVLVADVLQYDRLPASTDLVAAGFPCQDLSQAGKTLGIHGSRSGLIGEVFRLLRQHDVPWVLLENVSFMRHLGRGHALDVILTNLENLGYMWAYRVLDSRAFGLPQRRERVFFLASKVADPRDVLLREDVGEPEHSEVISKCAHGFYWTEGTRGLGWAVDAIPTLKGGSTLGIPSPPAIWLPSGEIVTPSIRAAERLQGFPPDWTRAALQVGKAGLRWKLVGNAVSVPVAKWIGDRLNNPDEYLGGDDRPLRRGRSWPRAAYNVGSGRFIARVSSWPARLPRRSLADFLSGEDLSPLSLKAVTGFLSRFEASTLVKPPGFLEALRAHKARMLHSTV